MIFKPSSRTNKIKLKNITGLPGVLLCMLCTSSLFAQVTIQPSDNSNSQDQKNKPYLIVICGDGFRYDYATKYHAENLLNLSAKGVEAERMIPSYPSVTHPNHYTMLSGLYPGHTGIVGNSFYDPERKAYFKTGDGTWFNGEPIWASAEKQHLLTASFRWVDAGNPIGGLRTSYNFKPQKKGGNTKEQAPEYVRQLLQLPVEKRPHLILIYFGDTDHAGHEFGPESNETRLAVKDVDAAIGKINQVALDSKLDISFIFVSDHGMTAIDRKPITLPEIDSASFVINNQNPLVNLYAKNKSAIIPTYQKLKDLHSPDYQVYLTADIPAKLHYGGKDDRYNRVGDIVLIATYPKTFNPKPGPGAHGYDPLEIKEMGATFRAWGPAFKSGLKIPAFENVELYSMMNSILGLKEQPHDGKGELKKIILR